MDAVGDNVSHRGLIGDGQINRIGQSNRGASMALLAVAASAVLRVESVKVQNVVRRNWFRINSWFTIQRTAGSEHRQAEDHRKRESSDRLRLHLHLQLQLRLHL